MGAAAAGLDFGMVRAEVEGAYRWNEVETLGGLGADGDISATTVMANVLLDIPVTNRRVEPFIGIGAGAALMDYSGVRQNSFGIQDDSDTVFAMQATTGLNYIIDEQISLTVAYAYLHAPDVSLRATNGTAIDTDYTSHSVTLGLRYTFAEPEPEVVTPLPRLNLDAVERVSALRTAGPDDPNSTASAAGIAAASTEQASVVPVTFTVFFGFDIARLSEENRQALDRAIAAANLGADVRLKIVGHTDRAGSEAYNQRLSLRRAEAVRDYLVANGWPAEAIEVAGRGESAPAVATPDGVPEQANRRAEVNVTR